MNYVLVLVYLVLTTSGLIFIKLGGNPGTLALKEGNLALSINWISGIGLICYLCSFLLFTRIVGMFNLSYIFPIVTGIVQIITLVASKFVFKEELSIQAIIGASLVIVGIVIMNFKNTQITA